MDFLFNWKCGGYDQIFNLDIVVSELIFFSITPRTSLLGTSSRDIKSWTINLSIISIQFFFLSVLPDPVSLVKKYQHSLATQIFHVSLNRVAS